MAVADASNLTLDPDLDSYYVMDVAILRVPALHDAAGELAQAAQTPTDLARLAVAKDRLVQAGAALDASVAAAIDGNASGTTRLALEEPASELSQSVAEMLNAASVGAPVSEGRFDQAADAAWSASIDELDHLLAQRIERLKANLFAWLTGALLVLGAACALILLVSRALAKRIHDLVDAMEQLASDQADTEIPFKADRNETGQIAAALEIFKKGLVDRLRLQADAAVSHEKTAERLREMEQRHADSVQDLAYVIAAVKNGLNKLHEGDLSYRMNEHLPTDYKSIRMDYNQAAESLEQTMRSILHATDAMRATAGDIASSADNLSQRTEQQAAGLEETAAALEQITSTVHNNAHNATRVREVATAAGEDANASSVILNETRGAMGKIERSSSEVGRILAVIDEIAFQTNLLALNAGVEAARAGEAGRGFAVVATEVRALAQRSSEAAKDIKDLINASTADIETGVELVARTAEALERIASRVAEINGLVGAVAASAEEEARGVAEVNSAVTQMDQITQQNAAMVEESTAASHELAREAGELAAIVQKFKVGKDSARTNHERAA